MSAQTQNILKWVLGIGMAIAGVKVIIDLSKPAPTPVTTDNFKPVASASASEDPLVLGVPKPRASGGLGGGLPAPNGTAGANPLAPLVAKLAAIIKDPEGNSPTQKMKDPQGATLVYLYDLPGLKQPVLITFVGKPDLWQWKFGAAVPPSMFSENGELEDLKAPEEGIKAQKIVSGPLAGAVVMTVDEQPSLRIIHSPALWAQAMAEMAGGAASGSASGGASGKPPGKPAPSASGRTK